MLTKKNLLTLAIGLTLVGLLGITPTVASGQNQRQYKLGGAWVGHSASPAWAWTALQIPTNPEGTEGALRVNFTSYGADVAGLVASLGADSFE